ncbi:hypothetical protein [Paenibacillus sp. cl141a]|nr:hypothetical protein [Paenibacillus sp. cl141a]
MLNHRKTSHMPSVAGRLSSYYCRWTALLKKAAQDDMVYFYPLQRT